MGFKAHLMEKMRALVGVHYQLHNNEADYLKNLWTNWTFLDPNFDKVYDKTISVLQLILLMLSSQKLADLPYPWLFLSSNLFFSLEQTVTTLGKNLIHSIFSFFFIEKW